MVFLRLGFLFWSSQWRFAFLVKRVKEHVLMIRISYWALWTSLQLRLSPNLHSYWWNFYPSILQLKWLFIMPYKAILSHCDYNRRCSIIGLFCLINQFWIWIWDSKPARIWTQISSTKSIYTYHWATLHWLQASIEFLHCFEAYIWV